MADDSDCALLVRGLVKHFGEVEAVRGVDLEVRRGECFGLLGPNGAGKTTTVEILEGLQAPTSGEVVVLGLSWGTGRDDEIRERIGVALQETELADKLTVAEVTRLFRSFYRQGRTVDQVLDLVDLGPKRGTRVSNLSGGQRQRLAVACALVSDPELLFLDEPTTGLDPQARRRLWDVIGRYLDDGGTVILTTHYMEEAAQMCHRLAIMDAGKVIAEGTPDGLIANLGASQVIRLRTDVAVDLGGLAGVSSAERRGEHDVLRVEDVAQVLPAALALIESSGARLLELATHRATLDDVFLHLTGKDLRDG
ncbi:ABC transporter ATP-binding protein [Engelhardtia mirabilis]|uniref:Daunorubicin/doxorubicin resistance ATP-binding protein DrrA n=1 Tax=Engelhardtia mirabilis TaxID=2528011 RepID=A0A518BLK8_9BACT|nr:Daunorubicin/doxorubicin resistance ATP-binding protein DrrA [Planctomycetes bacterium Pla133]QDV02180.1 Daunorubicin/doxorubicin resistance ATP-binding protein DrrA [Planctomycetes bacterium Pla86]